MRRENINTGLKKQSAFRNFRKAPRDAGAFALPPTRSTTPKVALPLHGPLRGALQIPTRTDIERIYAVRLMLSDSSLTTIDPDALPGGAVNFNDLM